MSSICAIYFERLFDKSLPHGNQNKLEKYLTLIFFADVYLELFRKNSAFGVLSYTSSILVCFSFLFGNPLGVESKNRICGKTLKYTPIGRWKARIFWIELLFGRFFPFAINIYIYMNLI